MNKKTLKVVLEVGVPVFVGRLPDNSRKSPELIELITLDCFRISGGVMHWTIIDGKKRIYQGGLNIVSIGSSITITPGLPILLNKRWNGLSPEFVFRVDNDISVLPLKEVSKRYLKHSGTLFQSIKRN